MTMQDPLHILAYDWAVRSFGIDHVTNVPLRALRHVEEATELAQTLQVPKEKLHALIDIVYSRKTGGVKREVGGDLMTLYVLCVVIGVDPEHAFRTELQRVLNLPPEHFAKRNKEKLDLGLDVKQ